AAERMAHVLASSRYATGLLLRAPEAVAIFGDDAELNPRSLTGLRAEMTAAIQRYEDDAEAAVTAVRSVRRRELLRTSAADVLFVHDPLRGRPEKEASDAAHAVAAELRRLLMLPVPDPALIVDADLRPEGRQGPLVRTLASYRAYYRRWSAPWEAQALLRAE